MASQRAIYAVVDLEKKRRDRALAKSKSSSAESSSTARPPPSQVRHEYEEITEVQQAEHEINDTTDSSTAETRPQQVPTDLSPRTGRDKVGRSGQQPSLDLKGKAPKAVYSMILEETMDSNANPGGTIYQTPNTTKKALNPPKEAGKERWNSTCSKQLLLLVASVTAALLILLLLTTACVVVLFVRVDSLKSELMAAQKSLQSNLALLTDQQVLVSDRLSQLNTTNILETNDVLHQVLSLLNDTILDIVATYNLGQHPSNAATSCSILLAFSPSTPSGYYWVRAANGSALQIYCDMIRMCGNITGGWTRVAQLDMTQSSSQCPGDFREYNDNRICGIRRPRSNHPPDCSTVTFDITIQYSKVCGRIRAYQSGTPEAFHSGHGIDTEYVDGISLTHGSPRQHIWTFAAASDASSNTCPCANNESTLSSPFSFVGNDYFCDTANSEPARYQLYLTNPLWEGEGCNAVTSCCSLNSPPWFYTQLPQPTTDHMEMRACSNYFRSLADIAIESFEIYVQ